MLHLPGENEPLSSVERLANASLTTMALPTTIQQDDNDDKTERVTQLLTSIPDSLIKFNHVQEMPVSKEFLGVTMFADISGFTALTEKYSAMESEHAGRGTDKLCATLNTYIGMIVDEIVSRHGDVLKFAGDAILALWKFTDIGHNAKTTLNKVINCCFDIQEKCEDYMTEVGVVLRVKLAVAVGSMCLTIVGLPQAKQFDLSGSAIIDVGKTEKEAVPGSIILSKLAWNNCEQRMFTIEPIKGGQYLRVTGLAHFGNTKNTNDTVVPTLLQSQQTRLVTSDIDYAIDKVLDYRQDMPKALQPDIEEEKMNTGLFLTQKLHTESKKKKKKKKFDRMTMTYDLNDDEIKELRAYVQEQVLYKLDHGQNLDWLSEMRQVSVLFINMQLPDFADEASMALQKSFEVVYGGCEKFSGTLNKVFSFDKGCTFIVIFGLPGQKQEDDAIRALKCAHYIFESLHALQEISNESIGVTTGLAFCGVVGHKDRHEYTVIGSKVNMAARLMMFYPKKLTCDNDTYESARMRLREEDFITQPYVELKGLKDPGVVREYDPRSVNSDDEEEFDYPILGRESELRTFNHLLDQYMKKRMKKVVVITGDQGIGKARLLDEFMDEAAKKFYRIVNLQLDGQEDNQHIGSNLAKLLLGSTDEERQVHFLPMMQEDQEMKDRVGLIADVVGDLQTAEAATDNIEDVTEGRKSILIKTVCKYLDKQKQNHFIAIDNAMLLDENSWIFLEELLQIANIIIAFTVRSTELPELCANANRVLQNNSLQLALTRLNKENMVDFVCQLLHVNEIPKKLRTIIESNCHGIPSWCEQLIKNMLHSNLLQVVPLVDIKVDIITPKVNDDGEDPEPETDTISIDNDIGLSSSQFVLQTLGRQLKKEKSQICVETNAKQSSLYKQYLAEDKARASTGAIIGDVHKVCILSPNADVNAMLLPDSEEDMVLARMDKMSLVEQTVIKCAAVLGMNFQRDLLKAIIPKNCANMLDTTLQNLSKMQFFACASLTKQSSSAYDMTQQNNNNNGGGGTGGGKTHHHFQAIHQNVQVLCGCYALDGYPAINLLQSKAFPDGKKRTCLHYQFCKSLVQETAFALWLEDQRNALFEKAALYLETNPDKCRACGGNGFVPGVVGKPFDKLTASVPSGGSKRMSVFSKPRLSSVARPDKNLRLQDLKKAIPNFPKEERGLMKSGDVVGLALVRLAALYNQTREEETSTTKRKPTAFLQKKNRNAKDSEYLALSTALKNFVNSNSGVGTSRLGGQNRNTIQGRGDLSQCQCLQLQALTVPKLVHYWKSIGSKVKAFQYSIELASLALDTNDSVKAIDTLKTVDEMISSEDFTVSDDDLAKIESLKGQALCMMDCYDDGVRHFTLALEYLKCPPPVSTFSFKVRLWRASMVQLLHQKMPGVFVDTQREYSSMIIEQTNILSNLAKAYRARREFDKAYLANLEQLNAAEEIAVDCWREVMIAYSDMIGCLHVYGKESMGPVLERAALLHADISTVNMEDMLAVGNLHLSLLIFYSHTGDIGKAYDSGAAVYNIGNSLNDAKLLIACIPQFVQVSMIKMRFHSCNTMVNELGNLTSYTESRVEKWIYYCSCIDMLLHAGDYTEMVRGIANKLNKRNIGGYTGFAMNYVSNGLALWYARQNNWGNAMNYYIDDEHQVVHHTIDALFYCNSLAISAEYLLHRYRQNQDENTKLQVKHTLKLLQKECSSGKGFLEARLYHFQAYFAYLKKRYHRARLMLDESIIESKNSDLTFDCDWAQASKGTWFAAAGDTDAEKETSFGGINYILPAVK